MIATEEKLTEQDFKSLTQKFRRRIIDILHKAGSGHPGGSLSAIDLMTTVFFNYIHRSKENASDPNRARFVLSKGHGVPALYTILEALGLLESNTLDNLRKLDSIAQGHPDVAMYPFVEASTGSLGQGLSIAQGMALAYRIKQVPQNIFCMVGDGEMQEGQIWEALMSAGNYQLDNLIVILDHNNGQIDGHVNEVMDIHPLTDKLRAFKWDVQVINGHNYSDIDNAISKAMSVKGKPSFIIAETVKGKGVSFMENNIGWHGIAPNDDETKKALAELS